MMNDTVIFMSAYETTKYLKTRKFFPQKPDLPNLLKKHHMTYMMVNDKLISPEGTLVLNAKYDDVAQTSSFSYDPVEKNKNINDFDELINSTGACIKLLHAHSLMADSNYFELGHIFGLQSFIVYIDDDIFQIDPIAFTLNRTLIIAYEIIDFTTGIPLSKDDTSLKSRNWNLRKTKGYKHFCDDFSVPSNSTISELVYKNVSDFFSEITGKRFISEEYSYIHNTLVLSNHIKNVEKYLCKLLGFKKLPTPLENISTTDNYEYYLQDGASVVVKYTKSGIDNALYNAILLEAIKLYIYLSQIINVETTTDLNKVMRNNLYLENLFFAPHVPVETHNLLHCIYQSQAYQHRKEAAKLKITYMTTENEVQKNRNTAFLNLLLYIASLFGAISSLDTLDSRLNIPFEISVVFVVLIFSMLGIVWGVTEYRHNKRF